MQLDIAPQKREKIAHLLATAYEAPRALVDKAGARLNPPAADKQVTV